MKTLEVAGAEGQMSELLLAVAAGEEVSLVREGRLVAYVRKAPFAFSEQTTAWAAVGEVRLPSHPGRIWTPEPVEGLHGGSVGTVEALVAERDERR